MRAMIACCLVSTALAAVLWEEDFNSFDTSKWNYDLGNGDGGWGNAELECYTNSTNNVRVENGHLVIEARREDVGGCSFTSGKIHTRGKFDFKYGTIEAMIKLPNLANGLWPAFWMLGAESNTWPDQGEIDILESGVADAISSGNVNKEVLGTFHWSNNGQYAAYGTNYVAPSDLTNDFHCYKLTWNETEIRMFVDGNQFMVFDITPLPVFQKNFYVILNLAVGGNFPNIHDAASVTAPLPAQMLVDYIKITQ
ncbi:unnamed protein product [Bursaphelenchus xylophilus]|uniref:(pine wood nematode) hypothetical protein n=1 Tax=Bursaphelenchus xylophilus TaxID=6326 RepID=A0A1I7RX89_BURXY|nr:unnamed protein product [Bursaphelenchus xylophilus]CAG9121434.1 unnamed protein product [Bursaphelenchus xylophilus]